MAGSENLIGDRTLKLGHCYLNPTVVSKSNDIMQVCYIRISLLSKNSNVLKKNVLQKKTKLSVFLKMIAEWHHSRA